MKVQGLDDNLEIWVSADDGRILIDILSDVDGWVSMGINPTPTQARAIAAALIAEADAAEGGE